MNKYSKILLLSLALGGAVFSSFADRGVGKKKNRVILNISSSHSTFKKSLPFNLTTGLKYKGSMITGTQKETNGTFSKTHIVTYQKGNAVYIVPYKQKVIVSDSKPGYTGMKLIIKAP